MGTRHHTGDDAEDIYGTCAEAIAALDAEMERQRREVYFEGVWDDDALAHMAWSIEVDRVTEGPRTLTPCSYCDAEDGDFHDTDCEWAGIYTADEFVSDWTVQQVPDLADRLVELLHARAELAWEVFKRVKVAGPWEETEEGNWVRSSPGVIGGYAVVARYDGRWWGVMGVPYATLRDAQAAVDAHLVAKGVALVGGPVVSE